MKSFLTFVHFQDPCKGEIQFGGKLKLHQTYVMSCNKVVIDYFVCVIVVSFDKRPEPPKIAELTIKEKWENKRIIPFETPQAATFCFKI